MDKRREDRIRNYMQGIRKVIRMGITQPGVKIKIENKLDKISLELKKDRKNENRKE